MKQYGSNLLEQCCNEKNFHHRGLKVIPQEWWTMQVQLLHDTLLTDDTLRCCMPREQQYLPALPQATLHVKDSMRERVPKVLQGAA